MEVRSKVYLYHTEVKWTEQRKGVISCAGKPDIQVATPPEFKGHESIWSPEDLFVASANVCVMTTFLAVAERAGLAFTSYESVAEGRLELVDGKFQITAITLKPTITLATSADATKAKELIEKAEANCLISNSMKARVSLEPISGSLSSLWRLAPVTRFSAGSFSPLAAISRRRLLAHSLKALFVRRFSLAHFHFCLASLSQEVRADEKEGAVSMNRDQILLRFSFHFTQSNH